MFTPLIQTTMSIQQDTSPRAPLAVRLAIVWLVLTFAWIAVSALRQELLSPRLPFDVWRPIQSLLAGAIGVAVVVAACRMLDRRPLSSLAFHWTRADLRALLTGAGILLGLAAIGLLVGAVTNTFSVTLAPPTWTMLGWIALQLVLVFTYEALPEELAWRGYAYTNLVERVPRWLAVLGQAVLFMLWAFALVWLGGLLGVPGDWTINIDRVVLFLTFGITTAVLRIWTGSLWASIGFHLAFQVMMGLLGLQRLTVVAIPAEEIESAGVVLWFFGVVLGGAIAFAGMVWKERRAAQQSNVA